MNSNYALIIIDVQATYQPFSTEFKDNLKQLIDQAKKDNVFIVNLTFASMGRTHPIVLKSIRDYPHKIHRTKRTFNGAHLIPDLPVKEFKLCGLYYDHCVFETAEGLKQRFNRPVTRITQACL